MSDFLPDCMIGPSEPCKGFTQMQDRLSAELAEAKARIAELEDHAVLATLAKNNDALRERIAALEAAGNRLGDAAVEGALTSIEAVTELAEARRALLAGNDTVLANKKLQEDNAAKDARIDSLEEELASTRFNFTGLRNATTARIAETERCRDNAENALEAATARIAELEEDYMCRHNDAVGNFEKWKLAKVRAEHAEKRIAELADKGTLQALRDANDRAERAEAELKVKRETLELVDADVRHHLRSDAIDHALLRKHAVAAVRAALAPFPTGLVTVPALTPDQEAHLKTLEPRPYDPDTMIRGSSPAGREG